MERAFSKSSGPPLDVIIPAREEAAILPSCLEALVREANDVDLKVVVIVNGPKASETAAQATRYAAAFFALDVPFVVKVDCRPGKPNALNRGDRERRGCPVLYLDADTVVMPGTIRSLALALHNNAAPTLISPRPLLIKPKSLFARHWARIWKTLPAVAGDVIGGGAYAVNAAGRQRWNAFPELMGDDSYVRSRFSRSERRILETGGFLQVMPEGWKLIRSVKRWRVANKELIAVQLLSGTRSSRGSHPGAPRGKNILHLLTHPALWLYFPGFLLVTVLSWLVPFARDAPGSWAPERGSRSPSPGLAPTATPRLRVIASRAVENDAASIDEKLQCSWAKVDLIWTEHDSISRQTKAAPSAPADTRHVLLLGRAAISAGTIDGLLALALRFPQSGAYSLVGRSRCAYAPFTVADHRQDARDDQILLFDAEAWRDFASSPELTLGQLRDFGWSPVDVQVPVSGYVS